MRAPTLEAVVLTGNEYSFIPFDPRLVRQQDGSGVEKSMYNPVGGGTSQAALAEMYAQRQAEYEAAYSDFEGFGDQPSFDPNDPYASFGANFDQETGSYFDPYSGDAGGDAGMGPGMDSGGDPGMAPGTDAGGDPMMGRRLLEEAEDVEYEGLAELSGCNCNMIVTLTEHEDADYKEKNKELKFYKESSDPSCYPDGGASGDGCTMTKAKAVLMYRQFLTVNDPCEFVKRSSPFQCVREEASPLTQRLSLAYANSGLLYGILCAMAVNYMYATKKVTLETVDIEQLQKLASMNKVSAEEQPAK